MNTVKSAESSLKSSTSADNLQVVVVDDSEMIRVRVASSVIAVGGATVRVAGDVPSGLGLLEARAADVLVLDIELPGPSGLDLLAIARHRKFASVIIILSIHDHAMLRRKAAALGADYYFYKLTEFERVAEVCRELSERRKSQAGSTGPAPTL
jgi:DNA-binding response OmpR family regulator